jgi:hypothetical protein
MAARHEQIGERAGQEVEMSSLTRHLVRPTAVTLSILFVVGTAFLASAQLLPMADPDICATPGVDCPSICGAS